MSEGSISCNLEENIIACAKECIDKEASALSKLSCSLDDNFIRAVLQINTTKGKIIVSGMGKSGHIARKIAATLSSVGRVSVFLHPAEASHGDLGIVDKNDLIILLSHSGQTAELKSIIAYAKRFNIKIIAITSNIDSSLANQSDIKLIYPFTKEACPMGLAPTTSTTLMLALGDALAVASISQRDFSSLEFKMFHPGGNLGYQLSYVKDFMQTKNLPTINIEQTIEQCINAINTFKKGCVAVVKDEQLIGIVTDGDLRRNILNINKKTIAEVMTHKPITVNETTIMAKALSVIQEKQITSLFVCDESKKIKGLLHIHDFLKTGVI